MIKNLLITYLSVLSISIYGQTWNNLVPNYSFESVQVNDWLNSGLANTTTGLQDGRIDVNCNCFNNLSNYEKIIQYWDYSDNWTVPDRRFVWCGQPFEDPVGTPDISYAPLTTNDGGNSTYPREYSGNFWTYTHNLEFAVVELEQTLQSGKVYYVEVFAKSYSSGQSASTGSIEVFPDKPKVCSNNQYITEYSSNNDYQTILTVNHPGLGMDNFGWVRYTAFFQANDDMNWLSLGCSDPTGMEWDDLRIYEVDEQLCRDAWYFDNTVFNQPFEIFQAGDSIKVGEGVDPESGSLAGPVTVRSNSSVIMRASNFVEVGTDIITSGGAYSGTGIDIEPGGELEIYIEPCKNLCPPLAIPNQNLSCVNSPINIGVPSYEGTFAQITWSPSNYLSDPNSPNPLFTPPSGTGVIQYTGTYSLQCDVPSAVGSGTVVVNVPYTDGSGPAPTVGYSNLVYDDFSLDVVIDVNSSVSEIDVQWSPFQSYGGSQTFNRIPSFDDGSLEFGINHISASCCQDVQFTIIAKDVCGNVVSTNFDWIKSFGSAPMNVDITTLILTPGTSTDISVIDPGTGGTAIITSEPQVCFNSQGACSYQVEVLNRWGQTKWNESGLILGNPTCLFWQGTTNIGLQLSDGTYYVKVTIFNDCGEEVETDYTPILLINGNKSAEDPNQGGELVFQDEFSPKIESDFQVLPRQFGVRLQTLSAINSDVFDYQIYDMSGKLIQHGQFSDQKEIHLSSGVYMIAVLSGENLLFRNKVLVP